MNKFKPIGFRITLTVVTLFSVVMYGQKQTKTYKETFNVGDEAMINLNTSHTDIEFETWAKNQVVVEAVIELEGATADEAKKYFENAGIRIIGNSKNIEISTSTENTWLFGQSFGDNEGFQIEVPEIPDLEPLFLDLEIPELAEFPELLEMPPMPPIPFTNFDYEAYKKDGEKYMKEWKEEFDKSFDEDYQKRMEEWGKRMEERAEERKKRMEERNELRKERLEERQKMLQERAEVRKERLKELEERRKSLLERRSASDSSRIFIVERDRIRHGPNIFYGLSGGKNKNFKVKKTIKIRMPKSAKLKMNVRHGEVKLAENTRDINATLSYARLLGATIDGDNTIINASYSPVAVRQWNYGKLKTDFSDEVNLQEVGNIVLYSNSSDVTIDKILKSALVKNNLGALRINSISKSFSDMDISVQNGEFFCELPETAYTIYVEGTSSRLKSPVGLVLNKTENRNNTIHKGFHVSKNSGKTIVINSKYSDVILEK